MMRYLILFCLGVVGLSLSAQNLSNYQEMIDERYIIVQFADGTGKNEKSAVLNAIPKLESYKHIPFPKVSIAILNEATKEDIQSYINNLETQPNVSYASFFLKTDKGNMAGVLNDAFIKVNDVDALNAYMSENHSYCNYVEVEGLDNLFHVKGGLQTKSIDFTLEVLDKPWVEYVHPNYILIPEVTTNDTYFNRQWALKNEGTIPQGGGTIGADMGVEAAWGITTGDPNIKIAVLDSGVDTLHEDLVDNMLKGYDAVGDSTDGYPTPNYSNDGHGTACAGIIAAKADNSIGVAGVAYDCSIIPVRIFYYVNLPGQGIIPFTTAAALMRGINWTWMTGDADIISSSAGLTDDFISIIFPTGTSAMEDAMQTAYENGRGGLGIPMLFSSGNDDEDKVIWPSSLDFTIAVNATSMCDERKSSADCSSENWGGNYDKGLSISAPGVFISTTDMMGSNGYTNTNYNFSFNGTSAACPNAAGVVGLIMSLRPNLFANGYRRILEQTAERVGGYDYDSTGVSGTWSKELGYGRINAHSALLAAPNYTNIEESVNEASINIYPNPVSDILTINSGTTEVFQLNIVDLKGVEIYSNTVQGNTHINMQNLDINTGLYIVTLSSSNTIKKTFKLSYIKPNY